MVKGKVDLEEFNGHRRNFLHHLAFLDTCLEDDLKGLFLKRGYSDQEITELVNLQDDDGMTPLMYATHNPQIFQQLIKCGANINLTDKRGFTVAHHLMIHGTDETIKIFLENTGRSFRSEDKGILLKKKLGIRMDERVTLGITFKEQLEKLYNPRKILVGHRKSKTPHLDILSTHLQCAIRIKEGLGILIEEAEHYEDSFQSSASKKEEQSADHEARVFLSTGTVSCLYDSPAFVTETYPLSDPFHVCEAYGRYAPDFSFSLRAHSVLLDGFKSVFTKALKRTWETNNWTTETFKDALKKHKDILIMSQEYLVPLLIEQVCNSEDQMPPFFKAILDFFKEEELDLKDHIQKLLRHMILEETPMETRLKKMIPYIKEDESGLYFPFCYYLPPEYASILKNELLREIGTFPTIKSDFKNGVYRNMQALMRTVMRHRVGSYLDLLRKHEKRVLEKRKKLEAHPNSISFLQDALKVLAPDLEEIPSEEELKQNIRVNGRSVSFIYKNQEYILKVRKNNEDMRDHAEIACGLEANEKDIVDNYGSVSYGHMGDNLKNFVHDLILDKSKNPRISLKAEDLTEKVVLFRVKNTHYFDYLSDPNIPFHKFKSGLEQAMTQAFQFMKESGRIMETLSDISHDENRPGIFLPMVYFLDYINGIFLGTFLHIIDSFKTVDAYEAGLRDLGNALRALIKKNMAFSKTYSTYLEELEKQMKKDGEEQEFEKMMLINNMQESLGHTLMAASMLFLIRLFDHPEELNKMTSNDFITGLEDVLIKPFIRMLGSKESVETLRPFYWDMLKKDFEDFKANPHHFEYTSSILRHGDLSRNNYYQAFYQLTFFLMSSMAPMEEEPVDSLRDPENKQQRRHFEDMKRMDIGKISQESA